MEVVDRKYVTNLTRDYTLTTNGEVNDQESMTVPDQAIPIADLLVRYARDEDVPQYKMHFQDESLDSDDLEAVDINHMDLADLQTYKEMVDERIGQLSLLSKEQRAKRKSESEASQATKEELAKKEPKAPDPPSGEES